ncbi:hypothetical protein [Alkalihalophilus marmarensis]|uniref:hypothetical protein n=1 Tax=Alkalihalophilus marmarensis TaxID=521377 RepID=UPI002DBD7B13|nr:hypothetical protein [Alkalihalophilus marmarensis]MEC2073257.1 hypothetical protein [Alkalihalophilus marmarensis]
MIIIDVLYVVILFFLAVQLTMSIVTAIIGNTAVRIMEFSYIKNSNSLSDKLLNISFYALYGLPHFFYVFLMKRFSYAAARLLYIVYLLGLLISVTALLLISSLITEALM